MRKNKYGQSRGWINLKGLWVLLLSEKTLEKWNKWSCRELSTLENRSQETKFVQLTLHRSSILYVNILRFLEIFTSLYAEHIIIGKNIKTKKKCDGIFEKIIKIRQYGMKRKISFINIFAKKYYGKWYPWFLFGKNLM